MIASTSFIQIATWYNTLQVIVYEIGLFVKRVDIAYQLIQQ